MGLEDATRPIPWTYKYGNIFWTKRWTLPAQQGPRGCLCQNAWLEKPLGGEGSWELAPTGDGSKPCIPPALLLLQVPWSEKQGESPQTCTSAKPGGCCLPKGRGTQMDGDGERHPRAGRTDGRTHAHPSAVVHKPENGSERF